MIQCKQQAKKRRQVVSKRLFYGSTVAAAAVLLLFLLLRPAVVTEPDLVIQPSISVVEPEQLLPDPDPEEIPIVTTKTASLAVIIKEEDKQTEIITTNIPEKEKTDDTIPVADTIDDPVDHSIPDPEYQTDDHFMNNLYPEIYSKKRFSTSDKWSIALASTYSNAAGETPFTPTTQIIQGQTRIFDVSSNTTPLQSVDETTLSFSPPISVGINFQKEIYPWLSIGLGVNYTLLQSKFSSFYNYAGGIYTSRQSLHYVGLPVSVLFNFVHQPKLRVYAATGGMVEKAVTAYYSSTSNITRKSENGYVTGLQWSVHAALGVEVPLSNYFGIYLEPGFGYFFDNNQPRSIRTIQPAQFKAEFGVRVRI